MQWRGANPNQYKTDLTLAERITDIRAGIAQYVPAASPEINARAVEKLKASRITERVLKPGAVAPSFELSDPRGAKVSSASLLARGPLVVLFIRGRWCPFCVATLEAYNEAMPAIQAAGAQLVALSPMTVKHSAFESDQHHLRFPLLSDAGNAVARQFGLVYQVEPEQQALYKRVFINLAQQNGDDSWELPIPAAFVIGQDSRIRWAFADPDYMKRPEPREVLAALSNKG